MCRSCCLPSFCPCSDLKADPYGYPIHLSFPAEVAIQPQIALLNDFIKNDSYHAGLLLLPQTRVLVGPFVPFTVERAYAKKSGTMSTGGPVPSLSLRFQTAAPLRLPRTSIALWPNWPTSAENP